MRSLPVEAAGRGLDGGRSLPALCELTELAGRRSSRRRAESGLAQVTSAKPSPDGKPLRARQEAAAALRPSPTGSPASCRLSEVS